MPAENPVSESNIQQMVQSSYDRLISATRSASTGEWGEVISLCVDFLIPALGVLSLVILAYFVARFHFASLLRSHLQTSRRNTREVRRQTRLQRRHGRNVDGSA